MNIFATTRFALHLTCLVSVLILLSFILLAPTALPENTGRIVIAISLFGAVMLGVFAFLRPKETAIGNDELAKKSERTSYVFGYCVTLAIFLIFLGATYAGQLSPKTAFYFMAFPLTIAPSLYMVAAYLRGRAG